MFEMSAFVLTSSLSWRSRSSSSFWISASERAFWLWLMALVDCWPHFEEDGSCKIFFNVLKMSDVWFADIYSLIICILLHRNVVE